MTIVCRHPLYSSDNDPDVFHPKRAIPLPVPGFQRIIFERQFAIDVLSLSVAEGGAVVCVESAGGRPLTIQGHRQSVRVGGLVGAGPPGTLLGGHDRPGTLVHRDLGDEPSSVLRGCLKKRVSMTSAILSAM